MSDSAHGIKAMQISIVEETKSPAEQKALCWRHVCALIDIPVLGARVVKSDRGEIAIFRNAVDEVFALRDKCPHKGGPLSQGIVFGRSVTCPLHGWTIKLEDGCAVAPDNGCTVSFSVRIEDGEVFLQV
jgi:nitrite reductase (NADH) small subunit